MFWRQLWALSRLEWTLEFRKKYVLFAILLYVLSASYIVYLSFNQIIKPNSWNALFWILTIFTSLQASSKNFLNEGGKRFLTYYQWADPRAIIVSKILFNILQVGVLSLFTLLLFSLFLGSPVKTFLQFLVAVVLGSAGFAAILSMVAAIAARAENNMALLSILSFPLLLPLLITAMRFSRHAMLGGSWSDALPFILALGLLDVVVVLLAYLLFPYLWKQ
jgi:heme exporter protein B